MNMCSKSSFSISLGKNSSAQSLTSVHFSAFFVVVVYFSFHGPEVITLFVNIISMPYSSYPLIFIDLFPLEYFYFLAC